MKILFLGLFLVVLGHSLCLAEEKKEKAKNEGISLLAQLKREKRQDDEGNLFGDDSRRASGSHYQKRSSDGDETPTDDGADTGDDAPDFSRRGDCVDLGDNDPVFSAETGCNDPVFSAETGCNDPVFSADTGCNDPGFSADTGCNDPGFSAETGCNDPGFSANTCDDNPGFSQSNAEDRVVITNSNKRLKRQYNMYLVVARRAYTPGKYKGKL